MHNFLVAFIPLFVTIDAIGMVPIFVGLTHALSKAQRRRATLEAVGFSLVFCLAFMVAGNAIFHFLGITKADFQIAGGLILLVLAVVNLVSREKPSDVQYEKPGLFPLAMPIIAGPATLTTTLVLVGRFEHGYFMTTLSLIANFAVLLVVLLASDTIIRVAGVNASRAFSKLVMVLLAAIAVFLIRTGVAELRMDGMAQRVVDAR